MGDFFVGIAKEISGLTTDVFPNPSTDVIQFIINAASASEGTILISDVFGRQIVSVPMNVQTGRNSIGLTSYFVNQPGGSYFVTLKTGAASITKKIVRL